MTRWLASAASTPPSDSTRSRTAATFGLEVAVELGVGELGEGLDLEALVGVVDEDRQQAADVRRVDGDRARRRRRRSVGRVAVLAEQVHLVAEPGERGREAGVVDVGAGAAQQVAVEDQDLHTRQAMCARG